MAQAASIREFSELLRGKHGIESRSAVLEAERVDFIRGKDFVRWVKAHPEHMSFKVAKGKPADEQAYEMGTFLLRNRELVRCERKFKKPPPGQDRPAKFPKRLLHVAGPEASRFAEADFYAWTYDRPTSPWVYAAAAAAAVGVFLVCLFPMAPAWTKAGVVYVAASLLAVLSGTLLARALLATATWILAGRAVWLLPNVLQDGIPFKQLFIPLLGVTEELPEGGKREKGKKGAGAGGRAWAAQVPARAGAAVALAAVGWVLYSHAPDRANLRKGASKYRDDIFDMFNIHDGKRLAAGNATAPPPPAADGDGDAAEAAGGGEL